jgi:GDPmannose 4,6-dehydratase
MKRAFITGITGQDGSYLAELLLSKGYEVHGMVRRSSSFNTERIDHIFQDPHQAGVKLFLHYGDLSDASSINRLLEKIQPAEIYHLGAQSHVRVSFDIPEYTVDVTGLGTVRLLDGIRETGLKTRFYQASSSEMYGTVTSGAHNEQTPFHPRSPYGCAKVLSYWMTVNYRESYGLYACNGILFNHESPRRGKTFVTRKITRGLARIAYGLEDRLFLGNLDARRDWGYAKDYVEAMWLMLQQEQPDDFVVATGEAYSVRQFVEATARLLDMHIEWDGTGLQEVGVDRKSGRTVIAIDERYLRPAEIDVLTGDSSKARTKLGWAPRTSFEELVALMAEADVAEAKEEARMRVHG